MIIINKSDQAFLKSIFSMCKKNKWQLLRSIKVKTNKQLDTVIFYATDMDTVVRYEREMLQGEQHCREFNLPYEELSAKIGNCAIKITFDVKDKDNEFVIQNGMIRKTVRDEAMVEGNGFPQMDITDKIVIGSAIVPYDVLLDLAQFAGIDDTRRDICQRWGVSKGAVFCTDARRLAYYEHEYNGEEFSAGFLKQVLTAGVAKRFNNYVTLKAFGVEEERKDTDGTTKTVRVVQNGMLILSNTNETLKIYDRYNANLSPLDYRIVIPRCDDKKKIALNIENLQALRELVGQGAEEVHITPTGMYARVNEQKLEVNMPICCELPEVVFNGKYLDSVIQFTGTSVMELQDELSPAELHGTDGMSKRHAILMPIRYQ